MCLAIAYLSRIENGEEPSFLLGENRDASSERTHERNHQTRLDAWPDFEEGKTWIGIAKHGASLRCVALLNYYPPAQNEASNGSRGFVVPEMLHMDEPDISRVKGLENIAPFQTLTYRRELHELVWEIWDGKSIQRQELDQGIHVIASSSYGVAKGRIAQARELIGDRTSLTHADVSKILASAGPDGVRTTTTPCMEGAWSQTVASHIIEAEGRRISIHGFAGSPADPNTKGAKINATLSL